jgi:hypothetical protein
MGLSRPRRVALTLALAVLAVCFALPASASASRVLYASGHTIDANRLATFGGHTLTATFDGESDSEWAAALARTDFDILIVGEDAPRASLSPDTLTAIANYVRNGKPIIIVGAHTDEVDFLNTVFGFSTTNVSDTENAGLTGTVLPSAAGTPFAGGAVISKSIGAGQAQLVIKAKGKKKRKLNQKGKAKLSLAITYTATGGSPRTQSVKVKLKKKLKKK